MPPTQSSIVDYLVVISIGLACIPYIFGVFVIIIHRSYPPMKIRSVVLSVMSSMGGLIWVSATIVVNNHFGKRNHTFWSNCSLWTFWMQACFGFGLFLNCMTINLVHLYSLLILKRRIKKQHNFIWIVTPLLLLLSPVIITSILASVLHANRFKALETSSQTDYHAKGDCTIQNKRFSTILLVFLPAYFLLFMGFTFKLRNFLDQYNGFRQIRNGGIMSLFVFLLSLVTLQTHSYKEVPGRCFLSLSVASVVFYYFWARNGEVIYNVLYNRDKYCQRFFEDINRTLVDSRQNPPDEVETIKMLLYESREQANSYITQVKELQIYLSNLRKTLGELEMQVHISNPIPLERSAGPE